MGNRLVKHNKQTGSKEIYIYDAQGNVMAIYKEMHDSLILDELHLYGSQRLGVIKENRLLAKYVNIFPPSSTFKPNMPNTPLIPYPYTFTPYHFGKKHYELPDWLGNVRVVINDKKTPLGTNASNMTYAAQILEVNDYYPFGSLVSNRSYDITDYRYGFGKHEKDNEISGEGNHLSFGDYGYSTRLARRWNVDPVIKNHESPYAVFANNPIWFMDPTGQDTFKINHGGKIQQFVGGDKEVYFYTDKKGKEHSLGSFTKNKYGYIQLSNYSYNKDDLSFGFNVKPGSEKNTYVSPLALGSLLGALAENNISDLTITGASTFTGASPSPSKSHILGVALDVRYLRTDKTGGSVNIWDSEVDFTRNNALIKSLMKFGFTNFLSEHYSYKGLKKQTHKLEGTRHYTKTARHYHHLHIGGKWGGEIQYNPNVEKFDRTKTEKVK